MNVIYEQSSYAHNASAHYNVIKRTITVNLTDVGIRKYDMAHYVVAMAHELGHAHDYNQRSRFTTCMSIFKAVCTGESHAYTMDVENKAYEYGALYIPYRYKNQYHTLNKAYINKLSKLGA